MSPSDLVARTKYCLNCGRRLERGHGFKRTRGYCGWDCYRMKPPKMAYVEHEYNKPVREVVIDSLNRCSTEVAADLLGISRFALYQWIDKLNIQRKVIWQ